MPTPSLILVPARFKTGKLYTPVATTSGGTVLGASGDFNVTRATSATRVNASGLIESVASGIPRLDYFASGGVVGCPALLVEPSAQNLAFQSQAFDVSGNWTQSNVTVTPNVTATLDPAGGNTADLLADSVTTGSTSHRIYTTPVPASAGSISVVSGTTYSTSLFVKAGTSSVLRIVLRRDNEAVIGIGDTIFNVTSGTITSGSGTIENYGNGWYRCTNIGTSNFTGGARIFINLYDTAGNQSYIGTAGTNNMYIWGAQLETGSIATSYIPTTTASATRNADVISLSGAVSGCIGQTEGTVYAEVVLSRVNQGPMIVISDGSDTNRIQISLLTSTQLLATIRVAGVNENYTVTIPTIPATGGVYKMALGYKANDYCFALNGITYASAASRGVPACNKVGLGTSATESSFLNDRIRAAALYTTRLTDAQLAALTT